MRALREVLATVVPNPAEPAVVVAFVPPEGEAEIVCRGRANLEHGVAAGPVTGFHLASVSKQFTAHVIGLLAAEGSLSLDDPVQRHVAEFPHGTVTIAQAMHHTAGLRDQWVLAEAAGLSMSDRLSTARLMTLICAQRGLTHRPGTRMLYSNTGYTLLARVAERVAGTPFSQLVHERVFQPLGMTGARVVDDDHLVVPGRADSYEPRADGWVRCPLGYATDGATSVVASVADLALWARRLLTIAAGGDLVAGALDDGTALSYGPGLHFSPWRGIDAIWHAGADAGFRTQLTVLPEPGCAVVVLSNNGAVDPGAVTREVLAARGLGADAFPPPGDAPAVTPGAYRSPHDGCVVEFVPTRDALTLVEGAERFPLVPAGDRYRSASGDGYEVRFGVEDAWIEPGNGETGYSAELLPGHRPTDVELDAYAGRFLGDELDALVTIRRTATGLEFVRRDGPAIGARAVAAGLLVLDDGREAGTVALEFDRDRGAFRYLAPRAHGMLFSRIPDRT